MAPFKKNRVRAGATIDDSVTALISALNSQSDEMGKLNGGVTLATATPGQLKTLSFMMPAEPPWLTHPIVAPTGILGTIRALMEPGGLVRLTGSRTSGSGTYAGSLPIGSLMGTMIDGYRPASGLALAAAATVGLAPTWAVHSVSTAGAINFFSSGAPGVGDAAYFDGMQWYAANAAPPHQFYGNGWPLRVEHELEGSCRGLVVLGCRPAVVGGQNVGVGAPIVDWQDLGDGAIRVNGVWGLQWGKRYELSVYLTPEEAA